MAPQGSETARNRIWTAAVITLSVHAIVLLILRWQPIRDSSSQASHFVEVAFTNQAEPIIAHKEHTLAERIAARIDERVANLVSDASKDVSNDRRSSGVTSDEQLAADVNAELRAMEQAEFARLASEKKDFGRTALPEVLDGEVENTYSNWDKRYEGQVTASFGLEGRDAMHRDIPGYRCLGAGVVVVSVGVSPSGRIVNASITSVSTGEKDVDSGLVDCLTEEALRSAQRWTFSAMADAPRVQDGSITYRFLAQQP